MTDGEFTGGTRTLEVLEIGLGDSPSCLSRMKFAVTDSLDLSGATVVSSSGNKQMMRNTSIQV